MKERNKTRSMEYAIIRDILAVALFAVMKTLAEQFNEREVI